jgi:uncharacterized repeat protein (TIGR03803 family)
MPLDVGSGHVMTLALGRACAYSSSAGTSPGLSSASEFLYRLAIQSVWSILDRGVRAMRDQERYPSSRLVTAALVVAIMFTGAAPAATSSDSAKSSTPLTVTFETLVTGIDPNLSPIQGTDGNLYGGTAGGGLHGQGTLFKMTPAGTLTTLYSPDAPTATTGRRKCSTQTGIFTVQPKVAGPLAMAPSSSSRKKAP